MSEVLYFLSRKARHPCHSTRPYIYRIVHVFNHISAAQGDKDFLINPHLKKRGTFLMSKVSM